MDDIMLVCSDGSVTIGYSKGAVVMWVLSCWSCDGGVTMGV